MAKRYLNVSYEDRDLARRLGAKWDPSVRRWYCVSDSPLSKIFEWRKEQALSSQALSSKASPAPVSEYTRNKKSTQTRFVQKLQEKCPSFTPQTPSPHKALQNLELFT